MIRFRSASASDLLTRAEEAAPGMERVDLYRRAAVMADRQGDLDTAFAARFALIDAANDAGAVLDQIVGFAFCLGASDKHPGRFAHEYLLWMYKWIVEEVIGCASVPLGLVERLLNDMSERYTSHGLGTAAVDQLRLSLFIETEQRDRLDDAFLAWEENPARDGSDCRACQQSMRVRYRVVSRDNEAAIEDAQPLLNGKMQCASVPHETMGVLHFPLLRSGQYEQAAEVFLRGYQMIEHREAFAMTVGQHMVFLAVAGQIQHGMRLFQSRMREYVRTRSDTTRIAFARGAWALFERAHRDGMLSISLSLPPRFAQYQPDGVYDIRALREHFERDLARWAGAFDQRNGNRAQADLSAEVRLMLEQGLSIAIPDA